MTHKLLLPTYFFVALCSIFLFTSNTAAAQTCHQYTNYSSAPVISNFGAAFDVFDSAKSHILKASCDPYELTLSLGNNKRHHLIYGTGYIGLSSGEFIPIDISASNNLIDSKDWVFVKSAEVTTDIPEYLHGQKVHLFTYMCQLREGSEGRSLKCGCNKDNAQKCLSEHGTFLGFWNYQPVTIPSYDMGGGESVSSGSSAESADFKALLSTANSIPKSTVTKPGSYLSSKGLDVYYGYQLYPVFIGLSDLYDKTKDSQHITTMIQMADSLIDNASDQDGDGYLDWYAPQVQWLNYRNHWHFEWRAAAGVARFVATLKKHNLHTKYPTQYAKYLRYLEHDVWQKWVTGNDRKSSTKDPRTEVFQSYWIARLAGVAIGLWEATGDTAYKIEAEKWIAKIKSSMVYESSTDSSWIPYDVTAKSPKPTIDISHSSDNIHAMVDAYEAGIGGVTLTDLRRLANQCTNVFWKGDVGYSVLNGTNGTFGSNLHWFLVGWNRLGQYHEPIRTKLTNWGTNEGVPIKHWQIKKYAFYMAQAAIEAD